MDGRPPRVSASLRAGGMHGDPDDVCRRCLTRAWGGDRRGVVKGDGERGQMADRDRDNDNDSGRRLHLDRVEPAAARPRSPDRNDGSRPEGECAQDASQTGQRM